jgi:hypothetical protein
MPLRSAFTCLIRQWFRDQRGQFALVLGVLAPVGLGLVGGAIDMSVYINHHSELQSTADAAVLAVAREASLKGWNEATANEVAAAIVGSTLSNKFGVEYTFKLSIDQKARRVEISLDQDHYGYFFIGYFAGSPQIRVTAAAFASGASTICIIVQAPSQNDSLVVNGSSKVQAPGCAAYSNSVSTKSINVKDVSALNTQMTCTAGGYAGKLTNFSPTPITDCPVITDPLVSRAQLIDASLPTGCDHNKLKIDGGTKTLLPGSYCKGLTISKGAEVQFEPGVYIIDDGGLKVDKASKISGAGVGLVFVGDKAQLTLSNDSSVSLSAPETGPMAGILIYGQPSAKQRKFSIVSKDAQRFTGTVYLPADTLTVGGDDDLDGGCDQILQDDGTLALPDPSCLSDIGNASDWTAIIARQVKVTAGSILVMNTNYNGSSVPVPDGVGPTSARVILAE